MSWWSEISDQTISRRGAKRRAADRPARNEVYEDLPDEEGGGEGRKESIAESEETLSLYSSHPFFHFNGGGLIEFWVEVEGLGLFRTPRIPIHPSLWEFS